MKFARFATTYAHSAPEEARALEVGPREINPQQLCTVATSFDRRARAPEQLLVVQESLSTPRTDEDVAELLATWAAPPWDADHQVLEMEYVPRAQDFRESDLSSSELTNADLRGASFEAAILDEATLRGANLYAAEMHLTSLEGTDLERAFVAGTKLVPRQG